MDAFLSFVNRYFGTLLLLSCLAGMFAPSAGDSTALIVMFALAMIIFVSFFQVDFSPGALKDELALAFRFWLLRFLVLPVMAYLALKWVSSFYASIALLICLLPAAVSSPSFVTIFGGKPGLSLKVLIYSSFLAIITIPLLMRWLPGASLQVQSGKMLLTLVYTIVLPFLLHLPLRRITRARTLFTRYQVLFTLTGLSVIFVLATARNRPAILENPVRIAVYAAEALLLYSLLYLLGYYLLPSRPEGVRRTFSISSGANNIGLGVTLTALYFPGSMNIFFIVAQLAWVVILIPLRRMLKPVMR